MRGSSVFASLALLTLGSCVPSRSQQDARSAAVNSTNGSGLPLPPNEASLLFTSTQISLEIVRPSPTSAKPFHGTPVSVQVLPPATTTPASSVKGANAQLPPVNQIAFTPANMHPFTGNGTNSTLTRRLVPRQACDPGIYCCPDPRQSYNSTQFPWVTIGRTQTTDPNGGTLICTGTMIGRRLVLTASHCINWTKDKNGLIPSISFQPDYWAGKPDAPTYYSTYVRGGPGTEEGDPTSEQGIGSDFVVFVIDVPEDFTSDYLGYITYSTDWNGMAVWTNVGYPGQFSPDGLLPYVDFNFPVNNAWTPGFFQNEHGYAIQFAGCVSPGDSGGPLFAWFTEGDCVGACVIGVVSGNDCLGADDDDWTGRCGNYAAGGIDMVNLISDMRADYP